MNARINYVLQKYKITRKGLGVTAHGLRHEYAARRFSAMSGLPPQAEGSAPASAYVEQKEKVKEARIKTSEQLGHWREDITSSYLGSTTRLQKLSKQRMADWLRVFENSPEVMRELQAAEMAKCWLVGKAGMGLVMMPDAKLELSIAVKAFDADLMVRVHRLKQRLELNLGRPIGIFIQSDEASPEDSLEIFIAKKAAAAV